LIVGALGAGLRSGSLSVRVAGIITVRVAGVVIVARAVGVSIRSAKAEVHTSPIVSAIARPHIITWHDIAAAVVARAAPTIHVRTHIALAPVVMTSAGIAMAVASVTAAIPSQASRRYR